MSGLGELKQWVRDIADVVVTVAICIVVLRLLLGANMLVPLVVVTSGSMIHDSGSSEWSDWMVDQKIVPGQIESFPLDNGFNVGDMMIVKYPYWNLGDVIIYERDFEHMHFPQRDPIIHRIVGVAHIVDGRYNDTLGTLDCMNPDQMQAFADLVVKCRSNMERCPYPEIPVTDTYSFFITKGDHNRYSDQCGRSKETTIAYPVNEAQVLARGWVRIPYLGWVKIIPSCVLSVTGITGCPLAF